MRVRLCFTTLYHYDTSPRAVIQKLRMTPRSHEGQHVTHWRADVEPDGHLIRGEDALGNIVQTLYAGKPGDSLTITVSGEADMADTAGVVRGAVERFPPAVFLRQTPLTEPDAALGEFGDTVVGEAGEDTLARLHALMGGLNETVAFEAGTSDAATTAAEAFGRKSGVCQDLAHMFVGLSRRAGIPARYVSGHLIGFDGQEATASHAWAEAYVDRLGWVGFDVANCICPTESHLRVAIALDYFGAAPVRGSRYGGDGERMEVRLTSGQGQGQRQGQRQSQN
jgi:transglutaminase-like putative cysteine protease